MNWFKQYFDTATWIRYKEIYKLNYPESVEATLAVIDIQKVLATFCSITGETRRQNSKECLPAFFGCFTETKVKNHGRR